MYSVVARETRQRCLKHAARNVERFETVTMLDKDSGTELSRAVKPAQRSMDPQIDAILRREGCREGGARGPNEGGAYGVSRMIGGRYK